MNNFCFVGRIGKDAELRTTAGGTSVLSFNAAVDSGYGDNKKTTWCKCTMFGKRAEGNISTYLKKGQQVAISGELSLDEWQGQDGQSHAQVSVRVNELTLVGGRNDSQPAPQQQAPHQQAQGFQNPPPAPQQGFQQQPQQQQQYRNQAPQQPNGFGDNYDFPG